MKIIKDIIRITIQSIILDRKMKRQKRMEYKIDKLRIKLNVEEKMYEKLLKEILEYCNRVTKSDN